MSNRDWLRSYGFALPLGMIVPWFPHECGHHGGPLRVDPAGPRNGSGQSWQDARNDLQAALNEQSLKGGGEVWVLGGEFASLETAGGTLLSIPSRVILRGGFLGVEGSPDERTAAAPATVLRSSAELGVSATLLRIAGQSDVSIERLRLVNGSPAFAIEGSQGVRVNEVSIQSPTSGGFSGPQVWSSDVRFEGARFELSNAFPSLAIVDSDVAFVEGSLDSYYSALDVQRSRLLLQGLAMGAPLRSDGDSTVLVLDSSLTQAEETAGVALLEGASALVGSRVTRGGASSAVKAGSLLVFNSSFVGVHSTSAHGNYPRAAAIDAAELRLSMTTFYDYGCQSFQFCDVAVVGGSIDNSLFARTPPIVSEGQPYAPDQYAVLNGGLASGNCVSFTLAQFEVVETGDPLAVTHPCLNGGDASELEVSRQRLLDFASPFSSAPFNADLSRYASPDWWHSETVLVNRSPDTGAPDPGRHVHRVESP
jgi:hypothetical protein